MSLSWWRQWQTCCQMFGQIIPRKYDMGTQVATAVEQGAKNFRCVRVTDGTDTAAHGTVPGSNANFTALYTGRARQLNHRHTWRRHQTEHLATFSHIIWPATRTLRRLDG